MDFADLPAGWEIWSEGETRYVLAYRSDVFDSSEFPAPCLPTIYLTKGQRGRRPGHHQPAPDDPWHVTLSLEPEIEVASARYDDSNEAVAGVHDLAARFADGEFDLRDVYQVPREDYLDQLDAMLGD
ncbi:DUF5820 family protein [Halorientalis pallida]|uniref:Uncharacterized protein n=1 Tax=Halorientalis pallida TaxID=2479928 RepID=A0A498L053_9EURY|nr:DUF5820 family protein [Halorientalis pallida]RXK51356.1 hypothetical protein EAF64_01565 [Halorientalis pallida]